MNAIVILGDEHERIEMELSELDFIIASDMINYSNLVHTFWKICELWEAHEKLEEELFAVMKSEGFEIPIEAILLEHKDLREHVKRIGDAINSGSDAQVRKALADDMRVFVDVVRKHMEDEDDILSGVLESEFSDEGRKEISRIVLKARK